MLNNIDPNNTDVIDRIKAREILLGPRFQPKRQDIDTPPLLLAAGIPAKSLRLVGVSADEGMEIKGASKDDETGKKRSAMYVCTCLRWRSDELPVLNMADVPALCGQDIDLLNALALIVMPFLGSGKTVQDEKKALLEEKTADGQNDAGGSVLPVTSDSPPTENASAA